MLQESRKSGTRSVEIALAEIHILTNNVYVERAARTLDEVRCRTVSPATARRRAHVTWMAHLTFVTLAAAGITPGRDLSLFVHATNE